MAKTFDKSVEVSVPNVIPPGVTISREVPVRVPEISGDVFVPLLWALISGAMVLCLGLVICIWNKVPAWWPFLISGLVAAGIWFWLIFKHWHKLWIATEDTSALGTGDEPREATVTIEAITQRNPYMQMERTELPISDEDLQQLVDGIMLEGKTLAEEFWSGKGKPFSKGHYHRILSALHQGDYIRWKNESSTSQGRELTQRGQKLFEQLTQGQTVKRLAPTIDAEAR